MSAVYDIEELDLRAMGRSLRRSSAAIAAFAVLGAAVFGLLLAGKTSYTATAQVELLPEVRSIDRPELRSTLQPPDEISLLTSEAFRQQLTEGGRRPRDVRFSVTNSADGRVLKFITSANAPRDAKERLTTILNTYQSRRASDIGHLLVPVRSGMIASIKATEARLRVTEKRLAALGGGPTSASDALIATASFLEKQLHRAGAHENAGHADNCPWRFGRPPRAFVERPRSRGARRGACRAFGRTLP
jgi:hypothetical protein